MAVIDERLNEECGLRLEVIRLAVAGLGPSAPIRLLLLGAEQIEQYVRFGNLPPVIAQDDGDKS